MSEETSSAQAPVAVSVIIVNWNSKDYLRQCLTSLYRHCTKTVIEIIVVDGASFDGCGEMLANEFPSVIFIQSKENVGFAKANNLGARSARGDCLLLLNPDTEFIEDSIDIMTAALAGHSAAGAIGCRLLNADRSLQMSCVQSFPNALNQALDSEFLRRKFPLSRLWGIASLHSNDSKPVGVEAISGACILVRRDLFEAVGGFTEDYFMYGEDLDLCFKLTRAGHSSYYISYSSLVHYGGGSSGQSSNNFSTIMMRVSVHHFIRKNRGAVSAFMYRAFIAISALARLAFICPLLIFGNRVVTHGSASLRKWRAILQWSLGLNRQVAKPRAAQTATPASASAETN